MGSRLSLVESVAGDDTAESDDHELEGQSVYNFLYASILNCV